MHGPQPRPGRRGADHTVGHRSGRRIRPTTPSTCSKSLMARSRDASETAPAIRIAFTVSISDPVDNPEDPSDATLKVEQILRDRPQPVSAGSGLRVQRGERQLLQARGRRLRLDEPPARKPAPWAASSRRSRARRKMLSLPVCSTTTRPPRRTAPGSAAATRPSKVFTAGSPDRKPASCSPIRIGS